MLAAQNYRLTGAAETALREYIAVRRLQPHFANARSIRNALDRARFRQANRLFEEAKGPLDGAALSSIDAADILSSRVFAGGLEHEKPGARRAD